MRQLFFNLCFYMLYCAVIRVGVLIGSSSALDLSDQSRLGMQLVAAVMVILVPMAIGHSMLDHNRRMRRALR